MFTRQQPLLALVDRVRGDAGFVDAKIDLDGLAVTFFWHGDVPPAVRRTVAEAAGDTIAVEFKTTPYTRDELLAEARRILAAHPAAISAGPDADHTGIVVGVDVSRFPLDSVRIDSTMPVRLVPKGPIEPIAG